MPRKLPETITVQNRSFEGQIALMDIIVNLIMQQKGDDKRGTVVSVRS
jgi:hypothetical protein